MPHPKANATSFKPGQSGNPRGRPKQVRELLERARESVPKALELAEKFIADEDLDPKLRLDAAKFLTSYGLGGPPKAPVLEDDESDTVQTSAGTMDASTAAQVLKLVRGKSEQANDADD